MSKREMRGIKEGLRVIVTAGAAGIGRAIAETFADRGTKVFICDLDDTALAQMAKAFPEIGRFRADVAEVTTDCPLADLRCSETLDPPCAAGTQRVGHLRFVGSGSAIRGAVAVRPGSCLIRL